MAYLPQLGLPAYASASERAWRLFFFAFCGLVLLFLISPILIVLPISFNPTPFLSFPKDDWSLRWYEDFFFNDRWTTAVKNSVIIAFFSTILATSLGTLAALGLSRPNFPARAAVMAVLISPMIVPVVITAAALFFFYANPLMVTSQPLLILNNTYAGVILAHTLLATPFVVITVTATLTGFDQSLTRAGASLGGSPALVFRRVILPLIAPGVISGALFAFVTSWDEVICVLFIGSSDQRTLPRQMFSGIREMISPTITAAAAVLIALAVVMLVTVELLRRRTERLRGIRT
ncbi:ABC transporter permease [Mesorhizobium tamadayense]|uniref:ABC transporter permease n=1 Tax=Mesorhizobium tamadayense TaxID=425306 RepID=A0A3P3EPJ4_9HYPH|nr:ABC transporter permease [Mesorhizobium tamadayense]RRH88285.1 ABC transporter permease [Mesorhizobium tamadayense]